MFLKSSVPYNYNFNQLVAINQKTMSHASYTVQNCPVSHFSFFFSIYFYQLEANYFTILQWFLSYIDINQPWIYMYSPSRSPLPLPSLTDPSGSSQCTRPKHLSKNLTSLLCSFLLISQRDKILLLKSKVLLLLFPNYLIYMYFNSSV